MKTTAIHLKYSAVLVRVLSTLMLSTSTYVSSGLCTSTSTGIRYSSTTRTSTKYSGPNPAL